MKHRQERLESIGTKRSGSLKIAVTGCAGSGKSIVCCRFGQLGATVISADQIARKIVSVGSSAYLAIIRDFGKQVLLEDGNLNRAMLRHIIVHSKEARGKVDRATHPEIVKEMSDQIGQAEKSGVSLIVVEVPLLFELHLEERFDVIVSVSVDTEVRVQRLMHRDKVSRKDAMGLLLAQMADEEKLQQSDFIIKNNGSIEALQRVVDDLYYDLSQKNIIENQKCLTGVIP